MSTFAMTYAQGLAAEKLIVSLLEEQRHRNIEHIRGRCSDYDIISHVRSDTRITHEVKRSSNVLKYGTIVIEVGCKRRGEREFKPSGLMTTKADVWWHVCDTPGKTCVVYCIPVPELRSICADLPAQNASWNSDHPTRVIRVPLDKISEYVYGTFPFEASSWC